MPLNLFIIGPSGCGKSTQAKKIAQKYNLTHLSMGQLFRDEIVSDSSFGQQAKKLVGKGLPVPDKITIPVLTRKLSQINNQNFIVDGFPRLLNQGRAIDISLQESGYPLSLLVHLQVDFLEIIKRRQKMGSDFQNKNRTDNTPEAIANRQKILYEKNIQPILNYFRHQNKLIEVDGNRPIDPIFQNICQKIDQLSINKNQ